MSKSYSGFISGYEASFQDSDDATKFINVKTVIEYRGINIPCILVEYSEKDYTLYVDGRPTPVESVKKFTLDAGT